VIRRPRKRSEKKKPRAFHSTEHHAHARTIRPALFNEARTLGSLDPAAAQLQRSMIWMALKGIPINIHVHAPRMSIRE